MHLFILNLSYRRLVWSHSIFHWLIFFFLNALRFSCAVMPINLFLQERITKVIALILSLQPDVHRPFLVISTSAALSAWDQEFLHLAPSLNVVVYSGNKDIRKSIRGLEFYQEGGHQEGGGLLFQVLITSPEVVMMVYLCSLHGLFSFKLLQSWRGVLMSDISH
jgi:hypothetical protein